MKAGLSQEIALFYLKNSASHELNLIFPKKHMIVIYLKSKYIEDVPILEALSSIDRINYGQTLGMHDFDLLGVECWEVNEYWYFTKLAKKPWKNIFSAKYHHETNIRDSTTRNGNRHERAFLYINEYIPSKQNQAESLKD